ncbi:MAG: hypothetical protein V9G42_12245 [Bacteroidia bacterium]
MKKIAQIAIICFVLSTTVYAQSAETAYHYIPPLVSLPTSTIAFKFEEGKIFHVKIPSEKLHLKVTVPDEPTLKMLTQEQQREQKDEEDKRYQAKQDAIVQNTQVITGSYNLTDITLDQLQAQEKEVVVAGDDLEIKVIPLAVTLSDTIAQQQYSVEIVKEKSEARQEHLEIAETLPKKTLQKPSMALINISYAEINSQQTAKVLEQGSVPKMDNLNLKNESIPVSIRRQHGSVIGRYILVNTN